MEINERSRVLGGLQSKLENSSRDVYLTGQQAVTAEEKAALVDDFGMPDMVNKPPHYQIMPGVEVIDVREALLSKLPAAVTKVQASHWDKSLEYLIRCWHKGGVEDLKKARFYLDRLIGGMEC